MKCKWLSDGFSEICVNGDCPVCGDWCVCANYPEICRYSEDVDGGTTSSVSPLRGDPPSPEGEGLEGADDG